MTSSKDAGNPGPFPEDGSGNFDEALEAAMGASKAGQARNCHARKARLIDDGSTRTENEPPGEHACLTYSRTRVLTLHFIPQGGVDDFLMGGDLTLNQIRTLSTTSQRSAVSIASAASLGSNGPAADDGEQAAGAFAAPVQSGEFEVSESRGQGAESVGRRKVPGIPSVSPRLRTTAARTPSGRVKDPSSPPKQKSPLPRVATLAQSTTPKRTQSKPESPPPFRAGGSAKSTAGRGAPGAARGARQTATSQTQAPSRSSSSVMAREMSSRSSMRTTAGTAGARASTPTSTQQRPQWGVNPAANSRRKVATPTTSSTSATGATPSRRAIVKPPENIKRAIKESQLLTDSLDSKEDSEMQNLKEILHDIKTIKTELGVESANGKTGEDIDGAVGGDAGTDGEAESAKTMPSPRGEATDVRKSVEKSPRKSVEKSPRKSPRSAGAISNSPIKVAEKEASMDDSDILGGLDGIQDEDATFLDPSNELTDELDEVSGPSYAKVEKAVVKEEIEVCRAAKDRSAGSKTCVSCCSVM